MIAFLRRLFGSKAVDVIVGDEPASLVPDPSPAGSSSTMPILYDFELSGSCYKVRLLANMLGVIYNKQNVDFVKKNTRTHVILRSTLSARSRSSTMVDCAFVTLRRS